ncbi:hypothetical protein DQQ10_26690, partial [Pseudochryseolinea flava]
LKDYFCFSTHKQDNDLQLEEDSRSLLFFYPYTKEEAALLRQPRLFLSLKGEMQIQKKGLNFRRDPKTITRRILIDNFRQAGNNSS